MTRKNEILTRLKEIEERSTAIIGEVAEATGEKLEGLTAEAKKIKEERDALCVELKEIEKREKTADALQSGKQKPEVIETPKEMRGKEMPKLEIRNTPAYIEAYANYVKTGDDAEVRAMLTENAPTPGDVPVPTIVDTAIKTAWENEGLLKYVHTVSVKGNLQTGFEFSADPAVIHKEGTEAPKEEKLVLGKVVLKPETFKKYIRVSDEVFDMKGEEFLNYIYSELGYRIAKLLSDTAVARVEAAPQVATKTAPAVAKIFTTGIADVVRAISELSDEATNPVIVMNKKSYAYYKGLAMGANYSIDPFDGLPVVFNNTLAVADGTNTGTYMIVGDFAEGMTLNYPNAKNITFKYDDLTEADADLVKIIGRLPAAVEVTATQAFCKVVKEA